MKILKNTPLYDGYSMPAEYSEHCGTIFIFPERAGSWRFNAKLAAPVFAELIKNLCEGETVYVAVSDKSKTSATQLLKEQIEAEKVVLIDIPTDDAWARDTSPTFVKNGDGVRAVNWKFNAWGGDYNGLYKDYQNDDKFALRLAKALGYDAYDASPFVLEGGSIHTDGLGTLITTKACLLSKGRNPKLSQQEIEEKLREYLGVKKIIWLDNGVDGDETDEHVDNFCAFVAPHKVVLAWTDDVGSKQYENCKRAFDVLTGETDAQGNKIEIIKLPLPKKQVRITKEDLIGFDFADGEAERSVGESLAGSYVNFYIGNKVVLLPQFGDVNDKTAVKIISELFPGRKVVPVCSREILLGGGNIHCITCQIPKE
ncbi:MAG: agmatine deiminase [Christensenellaceae bacterium]